MEPAQQVTSAYPF
ncbi:unnamed protein product, partial [Rotaria socialis]